ncbi:MAG: DegT/DnrJ/EryC1/StrS family aminotransferase [Acidobacteria bacterium]|nr:DegT/DnrJ/EryC1/StrS family aminotransferase [Acidobacteriota bacterium]MCA1632243.1 DegT/DnrJ/EryC1/StrS family aminotransferase [Acidobacteriota bacterium]MCA1640423.1 DegT/DnrJ/EryC1/StrS family aminotransferase [Acidobacteriota bacterium]
MKVPLLDLRAQYEGLREETLGAVARVFESQGFVLGADVRALEEEVAAYTGARHAVGCASGSDALLLALMALDVKAGDEVVTTPYSFFATAGAIARLGARPVFVDIDPRTYNLDAERIEAAITERTRALMPVHLYGQCAEMNAIGGIGARRRIPVVEDAAQAIGAGEGSRGAGAMGEIGCFSFYPTKNLGGAGDGGMLSTNDDSLAARLRSLRVHGEASKYHHREIGFNSRLDTLQAAVLRVKLPRLDSWSDARSRNAARYRELFADAGLLEEIGLPFEREGARHIYNQFVVRVRDGRRDALVEHLRGEGVGTEVYYPVPLHLQECFRYLGYKEGDFPEAERAARETLALPVYPELTEEQQRYVVESVRNFFC